MQAVDVGRAGLGVDGQLVVLGHDLHQRGAGLRHAAGRHGAEVHDAAVDRGQHVAAAQHVLGGAHLLAQVGDAALHVAQLAHHLLGALVVEVDDLQPGLADRLLRLGDLAAELAEPAVEIGGRAAAASAAGASAPVPARPGCPTSASSSTISPRWSRVARSCALSPSICERELGDPLGQDLPLALERHAPRREDAALGVEDLAHARVGRRQPLAGRAGTRSRARAVALGDQPGLERALGAELAARHVPARLGLGGVEADQRLALPPRARPRARGCG